MDAHLFRRFAEAAAPHLTGARIVKIQEPAEGLFAFSLDLFSRASALGRKAQLLLRPGRQDPFLCFGQGRVSAGAAPSAPVMRLRRHAQGRSIRHVLTRWQERELWLLMSGSMPAEPAKRETSGENREPAPSGRGDGGESGNQAVWLVLALREGPRLHFAEESPSSGAARWPAPGELACAMENWRDWPVLTPALRRTLAALPPEEASALLVDLEAGGGDIFCYRDPDAAPREDGGQAVVRVSAWPLPDSLRGKLTEEAREDVLPALTEAGADLVLREAALRQARRAAEVWIKKEKRLRELLELQTEDLERLEKMCRAREQGLLLQASLWQLQADRRTPVVNFLTPEGREVEIRLDPRRTLRENMERFFHTARRGERGLARVRERRAALEEELARVLRAKEACLLGAAPAVRQAAGMRPDAALPALPASVQLFVSSDGFALLRGRSARGNQDARRLASPHDIWVHAEGGPGAHVIIRRSHGGQTVPERTLDEAGILAACRSWLRDEPAARLTYCEVRHVRPLRGAAPGTMRMDKVLCTRRVLLDRSLEDRLLPGGEKATEDPGARGRSEEREAPGTAGDRR